MQNKLIFYFLIFFAAFGAVCKCLCYAGIKPAVAGLNFFRAYKVFCKVAENRNCVHSCHKACVKAYKLKCGIGLDMSP